MEMPLFFKTVLNSASEFLLKIGYISPLQTVEAENKEVPAINFTCSSRLVRTQLVTWLRAKGEHFSWQEDEDLLAISQLDENKD